MTLPFDFALFARFFDPVALALVAFGSLLVAGAGLTRADWAAMWRGARGRRFDAAAMRAEIARLERIVLRSGILAIEHEPVSDSTIGKAIDAIVDGADAAEVERLLADLRADRRPTLAAGARYWSAVADLAPAMGMIGTVIGLIGMFAHMDDVSKIGPSMALALLTTLYGAVLANLVAAPIAARLSRRAELEEEARARTEPLVLRLIPVAPAKRRPVAVVA